MYKGAYEPGIWFDAAASSNETNLADSLVGFIAISSFSTIFSTIQEWYIKI